jgi:hypothetical protein
MPSGDVVISSAALALFTTILTAVVGALVALFFMAWRERDRSAREIKEGYDQRYADMKAERDRLLLVQAQADRDTLTILAIIKDGVAGVAAAMATMTITIDRMASRHPER